MPTGNKPEDRPLVCDCGSKNISTHKDIGFDIDPEGEEKQHIDVCNDCGKSRLWAERWSFTGEFDGGPPRIGWARKWTKYPLHLLGL